MAGASVLETFSCCFSRLFSRELGQKGFELVLTWDAGISGMLHCWPWDPPTFPLMPFSWHSRRDLPGALAESPAAPIVLKAPGDLAPLTLLPLQTCPRPFILGSSVQWLSCACPVLSRCPHCRSMATCLESSFISHPSSPSLPSQQGQVCLDQSLAFSGSSKEEGSHLVFVCKGLTNTNLI